MSIEIYSWLFLWQRRCCTTSEYEDIPTPRFPIYWTSGKIWIAKHLQRLSLSFDTLASSFWFLTGTWISASLFFNHIQSVTSIHFSGGIMHCSRRCLHISVHILFWHILADGDGKLSIKLLFFNTFLFNSLTELIVAWRELVVLLKLLISIDRPSNFCLQFLISSSFSSRIFLNILVEFRVFFVNVMPFYDTDRGLHILLEIERNEFVLLIIFSVKLCLLPRKWYQGLYPN